MYIDPIESCMYNVEYYAHRMPGFKESHIRVHVRLHKFSLRTVHVHVIFHW